MPPNDPIDIIATQILFDAKSALANLKKFNEDILDSGKKISSLKNIIQKVSQEMGGDLKGATAAVQKFANAFTGINPQLVKSIGKELKLLDDIAQKSLGGMSGKTMESSTRMTLLSNAIQQMAIKGKTSIDQVTRSLQMLNASKGTQFQFGKLGFSQDDIAKAGQAAQQTANSLDQVGKKAQDAGVKGAQAGKKMESAFSRTVNSINVMRIALGAFISMLLFQGIQAVTGFFKESSDQARQMEETMYRLANAERMLSAAGQEITLKGLEDGINRIQKLLPIFAREDIAQMMGGIASATQQLGYTEEQIVDLGQVVAILNTRSVDAEDLLTTFSHILPSLLGKSSTGIAQLGISFNETEKAAAANTLGLLENGRTLQDLTDDELAAVKLQILMKNANVDSAEALELLNDFLDSNSSKLQQNTAAWKDLQTTFGQFWNNVLPNVVPLLEEIQKSLELKGVAKLFKEGGINPWSPQDVTILMKIATGIALTQKEYDRLKETIGKLDDKAILKIFPDPSAIKDRFTRELVQSLVEIKDTATGIPDPLIPEVDEDTLKALEELDDKLREIAIDAQQAREDLEVLLSQKQEDLEIKFQEKTQDIDTEYIRKEEDAAVDLQRKISDIERDAARDRQNVLDKAREEEKKAEEDHQLKLWELKMRYLMDLEDALHARDARQIIRLQRQYELDKELLEKKKEQEDQERQDSLEADLEDVEAKRQERLQDAQIEYQQKLADLAVAKQRELEELNTWKAREQADLQVWYQRELEEIDRQTQQKIERLLAGYIEEGKLHEEQQEAIHQILLKYFGENKKLVDDLVAYTNNAFGGMAAMIQGVFVQAGSLLAGLGAEVGSVAINPFAGNQTIPTYDQMLQNQISGGGQRYAEGGTVIATKPTRAVFGERGPELARFTPLNRNGRDVNKLFGDVGGGGGEGRISLDILLSPDLEARIIEHSMDGVAEVVTRVNRSKI